MKVCTKCKIIKSLIDFHYRYKKLNIRSKWCKKCAIKIRIEYHKKNRDKEQLYDKNYRKLMKQKVNKYLLQHPCIDCGESDIIVLEFDHVRGIKINAVSVMTQSFGWKSIRKEISKCEVRCANCHRRITHKRRNNL